MFVPAILVVLSAGAALLPSTEEPVAELAKRWQYLRLSLFAGAALLVAAVIHQAATYAWVSTVASIYQDDELAAIHANRLALEKQRVINDSTQAKTAYDTVTTATGAAARPLSANIP